MENTIKQRTRSMEDLMPDLKAILQSATDIDAVVEVFLRKLSQEDKDALLRPFIYDAIQSILQQD